MIEATKTPTPERAAPLALGVGRAAAGYTARARRLPVHVVQDLGLANERSSIASLRDLPAVGEEYVSGILFHERRYRHVDTVERVIVDRGRRGPHVRYKGSLHYVHEYTRTGRWPATDALLILRTAETPEAV